MGDKMCPILRIKCMKTKCAWYMRADEECAIHSVADALGSVTEVEGAELNVRVIDNGD